MADKGKAGADKGGGKDGAAGAGEKDEEEEEGCCSKFGSLIVTIVTVGYDNYYMKLR